jgi:hypothetical protein
VVQRKQTLICLLRPTDFLMDQTLPPASPIHDEKYDETLKLLRCDWKWAAASDFLWKFNPMLHLDFLDLSVSQNARVTCLQAYAQHVKGGIRFPHAIVQPSQPKLTLSLHQDVEYDLIRGTSETIFPIFVKILHVLTSIRGLS